MDTINKRLMKSIFSKPSPTYLKALREEVFSQEPLAGFITNALTKNERRLLMKDDDYWLVAEKYEWRGRIEPILKGILAVCNEERDENSSLLEQVWLIMPKYFKRFGKFHSLRSTQSTLHGKIRFLHSILTGKRVHITNRTIKLSFSLPTGCFLSLDTGFITNEVPNCITLGHLLSNSGAKIRYAMELINDIFELDIDNILSIIANNKGSRYYNITTGKRVNSGTTNKWPLCDDTHKIVADTDDQKIFSYISYLLDNPHLTHGTISVTPSDPPEEELPRRITPKAIIKQDTPKKPRRNIPSKIRFLTWREFIGTNMYGRCWCCNDEISYDNWHAGHVIPSSKGGPDTVDNLRPVCSSCNLSMGNEHMGNYITHYKMKGEGAKEFADYIIQHQIDELTDKLEEM